MSQPRARRRSMVSGSWAETEWRDDSLLSRSPALAAYTGGHPLEKRPKSLTLSHFSARPAWPRGGQARSANPFIPGRSYLTCRLPSEQNTMWDGDPQKSHIDFRLLFTRCSQKWRCRFAYREGETIIRSNLPNGHSWQNPSRLLKEPAARRPSRCRAG